MLIPTKAVLLAVVVCVASALLYPTTAAARTFERCDVYGHHCVRMACDRDGDVCWRQSKYHTAHYYRRRGHWVCDSDGDVCHYQYYGHKWNPHWDRDHD
jgi:hypothetical protein